MEKNFNKYNANKKKKLASLMNKKNIISNNENKRQKGFTKIFRNLIKKKTNIMKNILENRFNMWKKEAFKGTFIRKTVLVRISVSRDKIDKNRNYNRLNDMKEINDNRPRTAEKKLKCLNKKNEKVNNLKNINIIDMKKKNEFNSPKKTEVNLSQIKNNIINKQDKNSLYDTYTEKAKQKIKHIYSTPINSTKIKKEQNKKTINENNNTKPSPIIYTYYPEKGKNISKNILKTNTLKKQYDYHGYNSYTNVLSNRKKNLTNNIIKSNNDRKLIYLKSNFSETKLYDKKRDIKNTYTKKNMKNFTSVDNGRKYNNYTTKKEYNQKNNLNKENLKKGITTVIQHYLGVKERLDNYNLVPILN